MHCGVYVPACAALRGSLLGIAALLHCGAVVILAYVDSMPT